MQKKGEPQVKPVYLNPTRANLSIRESKLSHLDSYFSVIHYKKSVYLQRITATHYALQKLSATHFALQISRCKKQGCRFSATQVNAALQESATQRPLQYIWICQKYDGKLQR